MLLILSIVLVFVTTIHDDTWAAFGSQPTISSVSAIPFRSNPQPPITITAAVAAAVSVELVYRVGFAAETRIAMSQTGLGLYQTAIPGQAAGALARYQVIAVNKNGAVRFPDFDDTIQYDGVVVLDPARPPSPYPVIEWFYDTQTSKNSVLAYQGKVYDAVATSLRRDRHWKVEMPKGHLFEMPGLLSYPMDEFAFNVPDQPGWAKTLARTQLWYAVASLAGEPKLDSFTIRIDVNSAPWKIRAFQANMDDRWRQYHGRTGSFYEFGSSGIEKKFPKDDDLNDLTALNAVANGSRLRRSPRYRFNKDAMSLLLRREMRDGLLEYWLNSPLAALASEQVVLGRSRQKRSLVGTATILMTVGGPSPRNMASMAPIRGEREPQDFLCLLQPNGYGPPIMKGMTLFTCGSVSLWLRLDQSRILRLALIILLNCT